MNTSKSLETPTIRASQSSSPTTLLPGSNPARKELANRPLIREQAFGEALDPNETGLSSIRLK